MSASTCLQLIVNFDEFWTGLWDQDDINCQNDACVDKLYWLSDDGKYDQHIPAHNLEITKRTNPNGNGCVRFKNNVTSESSNCTGPKRFVCEFKCL